MYLPEKKLDAVKCYTTFCCQIWNNCRAKVFGTWNTQMECDSIHSVIERKIRKKPIFVPQDYANKIRGARLQKPYLVKYLEHIFLKDFSTLNYYPSIRPGSGSGAAVVTDIRILRYLPEGKILFKTHFADDTFENIPKLRSSRSQEPMRTDTVRSLYASRISIKKSKYQHLQQLKTVLPRDYHFYDALPHTN